MTFQKKYSTIGCCGIDCGLCPRYHTTGSSACPGCGGPNFKEKHPPCGVHSCCALKKGLEVCGQCEEYPCKRMESADRYDSFVTHKKMFANLDDIQKRGLEAFIADQKARMDILKDLLVNHDDGRSKSFYCQSCTLLPMESLQEIQQRANNMTDTTELKERCKSVKQSITERADSLNVDLRLNKKIQNENNR